MNNDKPLVSFDYAIKYLLKDKGDYAIVEGFISALLQTKGYKEVKIVALLASESNKEDSKSKRSLADVIVEDEDHHKYIIEIERNIKDSFIRPIPKLAYVEEFTGAGARRTGAYSNVREDSSTGVTHKLQAEVVLWIRCIKNSLPLLDESKTATTLLSCNFLPSGI